MALVSWSGIWVGALSALASGLVFGLVAIALGVQQLGSSTQIVSWKDFGLGGMAFSVFSAFFSLVIGGWVAARIAGVRRSETAMLHGAIVWLLVVPLLVSLAVVGAGSAFPGWMGGLAASPWAAASPSVPGNPDAAIAVRNGALGALTGLILGLIGGVIGGWMASGEPMTLTYHRTREQASSPPLFPSARS